MSGDKFERISQREYARRLGLSNEAVSKAIREGKIDRGWDKVEGKIIVEYANIEWGALHMGTSMPSLFPEQMLETTEERPLQRLPTPAGKGLSLSNESSFAEAKRVKEIIQAQLAALDLKERKEELVKKDEVYKQLYTFGQQMRIALMATPDRGIDAILAAKSRSEAYNILSTAIVEALEQLTNPHFDFTPRQ